MSALAYVDLRPKLAAALAPVGDTDPAVFDGFVDALTPPALVVAWNEPALEEITQCHAFALPLITAIVGRMDVEPALGELDALVAFVIARLAADGWTTRLVTGPRVLEIAGVTYLAARVELRVPVTF